MKLKKGISAIILTRNEEDLIKDCINQLKHFNEIIVIDDYSEDRTPSIAKRLDTHVFSRSLNNNFAAQRNFALSKAKYEWSLFIDADEIVSSQLVDEIKKATFGSSEGYFIKRTDVFKGKVLKGGEFSQYLLRLGKTNRGKWVRAVHEKWEIKGDTAYLKNILHHHSHENMNQFITQVVFHAKLHALEKHRKYENTGIFRVILFPSSKFLKNFVYKKGFVDGVHGFVSAVTLSFHSFLAWSYLWLLKR